MSLFGNEGPPPPLWNNEPVPKIDVETAAKAIEDGALLVEVGYPKDWEAAHIPGALLVEPQLLDLERGSVPKDRRVVVASHQLGMDEEVVAALRQRGYDAAVLEGGIHAWRSSGRELHGADGKPAR
jgi:rhodanese-related sulfurtransferase